MCVGKPSSGLTSISGVEWNNHCLVGRTAGQVSGGKVSGVALDVTGSDYTSG